MNYFENTLIKVTWISKILVLIFFTIQSFFSQKKNDVFIRKPLRNNL